MGFEKAIERVLGHEGDYVHHPRDPGGETNWGITRRTAQANGYKGSMRQMTRTQAVEIYRRAYWSGCGCVRFPFPLAYQYFDACVNHGRGNAARFLQRALGVADDGIIGNITLAALARTPVCDVVRRFNAERLAFYTKLSTFDAFGRGWVRRVAANLRHSVADGCDARHKDMATVLEHYATANRTFGQSQRVAMWQQAAAIAKEVAA